MPTPDQAPPIARPLGNVATERLDLRRFERDDLDELVAVFAEPEVWRFPYGRGFTEDETAAFLDAQIQHWGDLGFGCWVARTAHDGRIIGYVGLSVPTFLPDVLPAVEVGWRLSPRVWGKGYATEAATAALDEGFSTLGLEHICSIPQSDNEPSVRVAERLGMTVVRAATLEANERRAAVDVLVFGMGKQDWLQRPR